MGMQKKSLPSEETRTSKELSWRWTMHPSTVVRVMDRYGISGLKFGTSKQAARRFTISQIETVERLAGLDARPAKDSENAQPSSPTHNEGHHSWRGDGFASPAKRSAKKPSQGGAL